MRVWATNQWGLKFVEKTLKFTYKNLNEKLTYYPFSISSFPDLCHFLQLWKITPFFYNNFSGFGGGGASLSPPLRAPMVYLKVYVYPSVHTVIWNDFQENVKFLAVLGDNCVKVNY